MALERISKRAVELLKDPAVDLPKARTPGNYADFLRHVYEEFFAVWRDLEESLGSILKTRADRAQAVSTAIIEAWNLGAEGTLAAACSRLDKGLEGIVEELVAMSRRHSTRVLKGQSWYRLAAWKGAHSRKHLFHVPFELPQKSYRFSTPGRPTLYLANSVYLCWLECGQPPVDACVVSRFEVNSEGFDFLDLPCSHQAFVEPLDFPALPGLEVDPRRVSNSPYVDDVLEELAAYLTVWPVLAAMSVRKLEPAPEQPPEYVLPQLLMLWVAQSERLLGIRYFTSKEDRSTNSQDWSVNLAIPARTTKVSGYCDFLLARAECTPPQPLSLMVEKSLKGLVTKEAGDRRQQALGRVMLRWPDGRLEDYIGTVFGKMEYWLDRPEMQVAHIGS